jgi:methylase of polypeptide subunit release factors
MLVKRFSDGSNWIEPHFDKVFARPLTGPPAEDGFSTEPSLLLRESSKGWRPGRAVDLGMGQGRNAIYLSRQGWRVTEFDVSSEAVATARTNARNQASLLTRC